jgi:DNA primase
MSKWYRQESTNSQTYYSENQIRRTLIASGIDIVSEVDIDFIIFCPFHSNTRTPAGEVHKTNGLFYCFSCQETKTLVEVVMQSTKRTYFEAARLIDSKSDSKNLIDNLTQALEKKPEFVEYDTTVIDKLHSNVFRNKRAQEYFTKRKITKDSVIKYKLGYSENQDMVTIPVHSPDGLCIGFVGRSIEGKTFKNTPGLQKSKTLFNLQRAKKYDKVFIVESSFDAIRLEQVGVHALATLGATISKEQRKLLKQYFNQIILLADNDEAGRIMSNKLKTYFGPGCITPQLPQDIKDVSDMNDEDLKNFVSTVDDIGLLMVKWSNAHT